MPGGEHDQAVYGVFPTIWVLYFPALPGAEFFLRHLYYLTIALAGTVTAGHSHQIWRLPPPFCFVFCQHRFRWQLYYPSFAGILAWVVTSAFMLYIGYPWWTYLLTGLLFMAAGNLWYALLKQTHLTATQLIIAGISFGLALLTIFVVAIF